MIKWDGHTHSSFCRHGSDAPLHQYLDRAIELGFERYTVSEHPPLPEGWVADAKLMGELAMRGDELPQYFEYATRYKEKYAGLIEVQVGLELDYLYRHESFTLDLVDKWQRHLDDVIVSVHFLPGKDGMRCIDFTPDDFREGLLHYYGSIERVMEEYYNHVEKAVEFAAQLPMRKRIGHINLIEKFRSALPEMDDSAIRHRILQLVPKLAAQGIGVDVNTAGLRVGTCGKPYVPDYFLKECMKQGVECVFGSDAHRPEHVGAGWEWYAAFTE